MGFNLSTPYNPKNKVLTSEDSDGRLLYQGFADVSATTAQTKWFIRKFTYSTGGTPKWSWANGEDVADKIWDNRTSYTYTF